jgi:glucose-1-phosphate adenylyltransferase
MKTVAVILAGGEGNRLGTLTAKRTKPAVPFGGKFRIIDFALSNCVNSGLFDVMIVAQYRPHSLIEHIGAGAPWELDRERTGGVRIYSPYRSRESNAWFAGTADAVQQNFLFIKDRRPDLVVILSGDHIYRMNYNDLIAQHLACKADVTLATMEVPEHEKSRFGIVTVDATSRVTKFVEKPKQPIPGLGSMGIYVFDYGVLDRVLLEDRSIDGSHDFGKDILPRMIERGERVFSWMYKGYWRDVGTVESYWDAHMDLIGEPPLYDLNDLGWLIHTRSENRPPARIAKGAQVNDSLITHGCTIAPGAIVERSILSPGVRIEASAVVRESVLLTDAVVESDAVVMRSILDKRARVGRGAKIGGVPLAHEDVEGKRRFTVLGKNAVVPPGFIAHLGAEVGPDVIPSDLGTMELGPEDAVRTKRRAHEV